MATRERHILVAGGRQGRGQRAAGIESSSNELYIEGPAAKAPDTVCTPLAFSVRHYGE